MSKQILFLIGCASLGLFSCSDMMRSLQSESAEADRPAGSPRKTRSAATEEPAYRPRTLSGLSANNVNAYGSTAKRQYGRAPASAADITDEGGSFADSDRNGQSSTKRVTRDDFVDNNAHENSLWDAQGQNNYLFTHNKRHELGDVVSVDVARDLKREIQYALFMNLPPEQRKVKRPSADRLPASTGKKGDKVAAAAGDAKAPGAPDATGKSELEKGKDAAEEAAKTNMEANSKEDDTMRMEVVESVNGGMVRLLGQKRVIYRGVSRVVEVVALANSRDVDENGRIKSGTFMDTKTQVIQ